MVDEGAPHCGAFFLARATVSSGETRMSHERRTEVVAFFAAAALTAVFFVATTGAAFLAAIVVNVAAWDRSAGLPVFVGMGLLQLATLVVAVVKLTRGGDESRRQRGAAITGAMLCCVVAVPLVVSFIRAW